MYKYMLLFILSSVLFTTGAANAEDGYRLWLRYDQISEEDVLERYRALFDEVVVEGDSPTLAVIREELQNGLSGLLGQKFTFNDAVSGNRSLVIGTPESSGFIASLDLKKQLNALGTEGFLIKHLRNRDSQHIIIAANTDVGALYGMFHFLRLLQTQSDISDILVQSAPKIQLRLLNHWDNLNRSVERGYAGLSLWAWETLPHYKAPRYTDYARANASIGINGTVLNNVNADPNVLTEKYLKKAAALADIFRPYGIKVYLSANFSAPIGIGGLKTADPLNAEVRQWWKDKVEEIYSYIPDFGGLLVKANSEGQPGPQDYGRSHAEGANMLAEALAPHGGIVMWRAFVYSPGQKDRAREGYREFMPLDGKFADNVILQVKNGPLDFQPREPFNPLFGALPETNTMLELQITQEYFGFSNHLVYLGTLFTETLHADTHVKGEGSTVAKVTDGSLFDNEISAIAGVANTGTDRNWTGHPFGQANWYAYGRLAWNHEYSPEEIALDWIKMTLTQDQASVRSILKLMMGSREAFVSYQTPLGLNVLCGPHHYGPKPWIRSYYHRADTEGIGFDRTETGSNAVEEYSEPVAGMFGDIDRIPEEYLLWFHHVSWDHEMKSGRTLWEELVHKYYSGVEAVRQMQETWNSIEGSIDQKRFNHVKSLLRIQEEDAVWWRDASVLYFQTHSARPIPEGYEKPEHPLEYYKKLEETNHKNRF